MVKLPVFGFLAILLVSVAITDSLMCLDTEVELVRFGETRMFECYCSDSSIDCSWSMFANRSGSLSSGTRESFFTWESINGYGQYICVEDNSTVAKSILVLPLSKETNIQQ